MVEMNAYYARQSDVGPVFDVATYSPLKAAVMGFTGLVFTTLFGAAIVYVWDPTSLVAKPLESIAEAQRDVQNLWRDHFTYTAIGLGVAGTITLGILAASVRCFVEACQADFFIRVGEGGISIYAPQGMRAKRLDLPWSEIRDLTVFQLKKLGAMSRNTGNVRAELRLKTNAGESYVFPLDNFQQPAYLIHQRINEAMEMRPVTFGSDSDLELATVRMGDTFVG